MTKDDGKGAAKPDNQSDIAFVKALAKILRKQDLGEINVQRASKDNRLIVELSKTPPAAVMVQAPAAAAPTAPATPAAPVAPSAEPTDDPSGLPGAITSPMVGTVYLSPEPGAEAFVKVGDAVTEGQTLLIVEAMKTMNHIHAPKSGTVKRILVEDSAAVEYGAPLMVVE